MTNDTPIRSPQWHTEITYRAHVNHAFVFGKRLGEPVGNVTHTALGDFHARRANQRVFKIRAEVVVLKKCQRACTKIGKTFRHERKANVKPLSQMVHERTEKLR